MDFTGTLKPPRLTAAPAGPAVGQLYYNTTDNVLYWWNGTTWISASGGGGGASAIALVSALPGSPVDGQEIYFQNAAMATDGIVWHLRYRSGSASAYKWEVLGSPPALWAEDPNQTTTTSTVNADPSTAVAITVPLLGDYRLEHGFTGYHSAANGQNIQTLTFGAANSAADDVMLAGLPANSPFSTHRELRRTAVPAATVVKIQHRIGLAGTGTFYRRYLAIYPIRVG